MNLTSPALRPAALAFILCALSAPVIADPMDRNPLPENAMQPTQTADLNETPRTQDLEQPQGALQPAAPVNTPAAAQPQGANANIIALIDKHASANGIPASFARAIVRVESNYNPRATGRQGEVGLMQIKFETARGIGYTGSREALYDPDTNLQWGMKYLAMSWKLGGFTPCGAIMKYQGGHAVNRMTPAANAYCAKVRGIMASN